MSQSLFDGVIYYISETAPTNPRDQLTEVLDKRGATASKGVDDPDLTHFITPTLPLESFVEAPPKSSKAHAVTLRWVERSVVLNTLQDAEYYSADPALLFSGVTAAATDLSQSDCELISAAITALGGQWRTALTRDVTHLFALTPGSPKYETAMHYREQMHVCVVVPHWFDDTVRLGIRDLPTKSYEWPNPRVFGDRPEGRTSQEDIDYEPPAERMMLYETASLSLSEQKKLKPAQRNVWNGKRLLLGLSLDLSGQQRNALYADIRRQGGEVVELSPGLKQGSPESMADELEKLDEADIFVTRYRSGASYAKAYRLEKTVGTLAWLWYVRATGTLTRPAEQLLHYPVPEVPAAGFSKEVVTVTNYTGKDREYLKKLITLMGGEFTASMSADKNTAVVAAYLHGTKTDKATSWSIPIVNHTWVEDCFVQWRRLTPAVEKYIKFPPGVDFSTVLAKRGLGKITWEPGELEEMMKPADGDVDMGAPTPKRKRKAASASPRKGLNKRRAQLPAGDLLRAETLQSVGEVEDAIAVDEGAASHVDDMEIDAELSNFMAAIAPRDETMDVDEAGPSKPASKRSEQAPRKKLVRRYSNKTNDKAEEANGDDGASTSSPKRATRNQTTTTGRIQREKLTETPSPVKKRQNPPRRTTTQDESDVEDGRSSDEDVRKPKAAEKDKPARTKESTTKVPPAMKKRKAAETDDSGSESPDDARSVLGDLVPNKKSKGRTVASPAKPRRRPQRLDSVLVPSVSEVYGSPSRRSDKSSAEDPRSSPTKVPFKVGPPRGAAKGASKTSTAPKVKKEKGAAPREPSPLRRTRKASTTTPNGAVNGNAEAGPSRVEASASPSKMQRTPSKRSAATRAAQKLHEVVMPDLVTFQKEMKSGVVRAVHERDGSSASAVAKGKKRASMGSVGPEGEGEDEGMPEKKRRKGNDADLTSTKGKKKGRKSLADDEEPPSQEAKASKKAPPGGTAAQVPDVRIMTTQLSLGDDVIKVLTRLGVKFVTKPSECTHLLVRNVVRTEKFLCAMAVGPHVVNEKWAIMSAANRKLLPEEQYSIKDDESEAKYHFRLTDAVKRAKKNAGKLFEGIQFYVTPKVPIETKLLKNVVVANGGQLSTTTPTMRILAGSSKRRVISCPDDMSIWRPLAQEHPVYTQELILTSALKQEVDWDDTAFQVHGSF